MHSDTWNNILIDPALNIDSGTLETWLRPLHYIDNNNNTSLILEAPNSIIAEFVDQHFKEKIIACGIKYNPLLNSISINVVPNKPEISKNTSALPIPSVFAQTTQRNILFSTLNKRFTFDSFVVGSGNEFSKSTAQAVAEAPGKTKFNPLLIYGGVGLGKTHLLQAIGNLILSYNQNAMVCYVTSEEFYLNFIDAIKNNNTKKFTSVFRSCDCLLLDDVQFFSGKESTQEEFFHIFNTLYQNGRQIVLTSDVSPSNLLGLHDRLISRFQWGLSVDIQPPNLETRTAILKRKLEESNIVLSEEILNHLAETVPSNIRELEGIVIRLLAFSSITKSDITIDLVKSVLKETIKRPAQKRSIDEIIEKVAVYYNVSVDNIREKNRRKEVALCRQVAMYITKTLSNYSLKTIGLHFGGRDHTTVIHAIQHIEDLKKKDSSINNDINYILSELK